MFPGAFVLGLAAVHTSSLPHPCEQGATDSEDRTDALVLWKLTDLSGASLLPLSEGNESIAVGVVSVHYGGYLGILSHMEGRGSSGCCGLSIGD